MDFRSLLEFAVVAEELHFGRAAKRLNTVQPAVTRRIQRLEDELQFQLFYRSNRRVQLTTAGSVFLQESRSLLASLDAAVRHGRLAAQGNTGWINIGFVGSAILELLPAVLRSFRKHSPEVRLTLSDMTSVEQLLALQQNRIHVGFIRGPVSVERALHYETVAREPLVVALPKNHPLAKRSRLRTGMLASEGFILFPHHPMSAWEVLVRHVCKQAGFEPSIVQRTVQIQTAISLVSAGIGIALVPQSAKHFMEQGVIYRTLADTESVELVLAYRENEVSPIVQNFVSVVRDVVRRNGSRSLRHSRKT
jgi:DNA-binding transcriptional LysR family regulator